MLTLREKINLFISFFNEQIESIDSAKFSKNDILFKKTLYVAMIDALSKTIYPKKRSKDRFTSFIINFSKWRYCTKISLPHLARLLTKAPDPDFSRLREFTFPIFDSWKDGSIIKLNEDLDYEQVQKLWPKHSDHAKLLGNVKLDFLRHDYLLYAYRNSLFHELRSPGYGIESEKISKDEPFYHSMSHADTEQEEDTWELVYPLGFFKGMCRRMLEKLLGYYGENRIDPHSFFTFGTYWIEELNR